MLIWTLAVAMFACFDLNDYQLQIKQPPVKYINYAWYNNNFLLNIYLNKKNIIMHHNNENVLLSFFFYSK